MRSISVIVQFVLLFLVVGNSSAQSSGNTTRDTINQRDANNLRQGWWIVRNTDGKYKGYEVGQLVEEGEYLDNKKTGVWTKYYPNGNKKHELTFANNVANGYAKIYYRNGQMQEEGIWKMNRWVGQYKFYYQDGTMKYDWSYNSSGKREGQQRYYHENGVLQYIGDWKGGKESGELIEYYEDGSIKTKRYFNGGKIEPEQTKNLVQGKEYDENIKMYTGKPKRELQSGKMVDGYNKLLNPDGTVKSEGTFKDKRLIDGKVFEYENGVVVKTIIYEGGNKVGEESSQ